MSASAEDRRRLQSLDRGALAAYQLARLNALLAVILPANRFYASKLADIPLRLASLDDLRDLPFTTKVELIAGLAADSTPINLTWPIDRYVRYHQTSGTHGRPLPVYDTAEDWQWWIECWQYVLDEAGVTPVDRAVLAFSFGPFIGFWSAHDALVARGTMVIPAGGISSRGRLDLIDRTGATVVFCTPSYALHLIEVAEQHSVNLERNAVEKIIVAGEPGGSLPSVRERIEKAWQAQVIDHAGASEIGPWGFADAQRRGLHVLEAEFIAEFFSVKTDEPAAAGELSELVLTSMGRQGMPLVRYRTGDLVRPHWPDAGPQRFVLLEGGVLGRADDMAIVRGVNIFPSAIDQILRSFPEVVEYRATVGKRGELDELCIEVEDRLAEPWRIAEEFNLRLGLKVEIRLAPPFSLPRFEGKGARFIDRRRS
jgi:phenylacetate-CoA ligase